MMKAGNISYLQDLELARISYNFNNASRRFKSINRAMRRGHLNNDFSIVKRPFNNRAMTISRVRGTHGSMFAQYLGIKNKK